MFNPKNPRTRRILIVGILVSLGVFLAAGIALWLFTDGFAPAPPAPELALPPSLEQLAAQYPQLAAVLRDPALGAAYKELLVAYQQGGTTAAETLARERGLVNKQRQVLVTLILDHPSHASAVIAELKQIGVIVEGTYDDAIDIAIPLPLLEQTWQSSDPGKVFKQLSAINHVVKIRLPLKNRSDAIGWLSEGVGATGAQAWHQAGFTGKGIKIGILDQGFDGYKNQVGKTLPARVTAKSFVTGEEPDQTGEAHGLLCAEIAAAMAPDAELFFAYYDRGANQRAAVDWLVEQGVQIISHSAGGFSAPMDGTGTQAQMVDSVAARGVLWINSAANQGDGHYRATFNDARKSRWHSFPGGAESLKITFESLTRDTEIVLRWDNWGGNAAEDYDLFVYDDKGVLVARSDDAQAGKPGDYPVERAQFRPTRTNYFVKIFAKTITHPGVFDLYVYNGKLATTTPEYSLGTPADARGALAVGAINWRDNTLESFSSRGPTTDGRIKPEVVAPDRVKTSKGVFWGTSAAAPHVAGAAALVWSRFPPMTANQVRAYLEANAIDMGAPGADTTYGFGRLQLPAPNAATPNVQPAPTGFAGLPTRAPIPAPPPSVPTTPANAWLAITILGLLTCVGFTGAVGGLGLLFLISRTSRPPTAPPSAVSLPTPRAPTLVLVNATGRRIEIQRGISVVGRSSKSVIQLDDPQVSRQHAQISWNRARVTLMDLGSTNGTFLNGQRLSPRLPVALNVGDQVTFGSTDTWRLEAGV